MQPSNLDYPILRINDQVGQAQKMLNTAGAVSWHRVAGIFGNTVSQPVGTTAANPQRFPGQQFDANLGLHYNYFRDYDPATGRYLETDPIGLEGGTNLYAYADGNPVSNIDPDGRIALNLITGGIGAVVGGGTNFGTQLYNNGGDVFAVRYRDVGVATVVGGGAGFVAPVAAPGIIGAIGLGGISSVAQTGLTNWVNGRRTTPCEVLTSGGTGAVSGLIGGGTGYPPSGRSVADAISDVADKALARRVNESRRARDAVSVTSFLRNLASGIFGQ